MYAGNARRSQEAFTGGLLCKRINCASELPSPDRILTNFTVVSTETGESQSETGETDSSRWPSVGEPLCGDSDLDSFAGECRTDTLTSFDLPEYAPVLRPPSEALDRQYRRPQARVVKPKEASAQNRLHSRLDGVIPSDFHPDGVLIYLTAQIQAPEGFQHISTVVTRQYEAELSVSHTLRDEEIHNICRTPAVLIFCDISDEWEMERAMLLNDCVANLGDRAPPTILVPHSASGTQLADDDKQFEILSGMMSSGIDCAIMGEPEGIRLACDVRAEIMTQANYAHSFETSLEVHRKNVRDAAEHAADLEDLVEDTFWGYLRARLSIAIPCADYSIGPCKPGALIGNFQVARRLGEGASGAVYALTDRACEGSQASGTQVVKAVSKKELTNVASLKTLHNEIKIMLELSSEQWQHKNIIQLHEVYHSETHILLRMENGGSHDLFKYLRAREIKRLPLGPHKAQSIAYQCLAGICHMHMGPKVAHRDIKPENIMIHDTGDDIVVKLCDFDLSRRMQTPGLSMSVGGTFPFMAPEMHMRRPYDPIPTDIWSMGIVFLEVLCVSGILAKVLSFPRVPPNSPERKLKEEMMNQEIKTLFEKPGSVQSLLVKFHGTGLRALIDSSMTELVVGMLTVDVAARSTAEDLQARMEPLLRERTLCKGLVANSDECY